MLARLSRISSAMMRSAPLLPQAVGLTAGVALDGRYAMPVAAYLAAFVAANALMVPRRLRAGLGPVLILAASAAVGGTMHAGRVRLPPADGLARYAAHPGSLVRVHGRVASEPRVLASESYSFSRWSHDEDRMAFVLQAESLEGSHGDIPVRGLVRVVLNEPILDLHEQEPIEVFGWLLALRPPANPGSFDWGQFQRRQGITATLRGENARCVRRFDPTRRAWLTDVKRWVRSRLRGWLVQDLATGAREESDLLHAMVLGHRADFDRRLNDLFIRSGCIHFLAASGINVAIVMSLALLAARILRLRPSACTAAMLASAIAFALITEPRPPILRATVMGLTYCFARFLGRERACLNWLALSVVLLVVIDPAIVFDVGFQLSCMAVLGVTYVGGGLAEAAASLRRWGSRKLRRVPSAEADPLLAVRAPVTRSGWRGALRSTGAGLSRWTATALYASFGAWLASWPIIAAHFQRLQPWGAINSVIVMPMMTFIMALGFAKLILGTISPAAGALLFVLLHCVDAWLLQLVEWLAALPGTTIMPPRPAWWVLVAFYAAAGAFLGRFPPRTRRHGIVEAERQPDVQIDPAAPRRAWRCAFVGLTIAFVIWLWPRSPVEKLTATVLSVGRGSATVIELPDGRTVLYDAGGSGSSDVGRGIIVPFLRHRGIERIDRVFLSHPNLDHYSGLPSVLAEILTGPVVLNRYFEPNSPEGSPSRHLLKLLFSGGHAVQMLESAPHSWEAAGVTFELLWPPADLPEHTESNDTSTVVRLTYRGRSILFTGDVEESAQRALLRSGKLRADVLVLPHHGGVRPSTAEFLRAVAPSWVIRSTFERTEDTLTALPAIVGTIPCFNTADAGAVQVVIDQDGVGVKRPCETKNR